MGTCWRVTPLGRILAVALPRLTDEPHDSSDSATRVKRASHLPHAREILDPHDTGRS